MAPSSPYPWAPCYRPPCAKAMTAKGPKMRAIAWAVPAAVLLVGCGPREDAAPRSPGPRPASEAGAAPQALRREPWFFCDAIDRPAVLVGHAEQQPGAARIDIHSKAGAAPSTMLLTLGPQEGAAGSVYQPLLRDGADAGHVRTLNSGMLDDPNAAYTRPVVSVRIGEDDYSCRWLART